MYASARDGYASYDERDREGDMRPIFESILKEVPAPKGDVDAPLQVLFSSLDYDDYVGRMGIGRIERGTIRQNEPLVLCKADGSEEKVKVSKLYVYEGLARKEVKEPVRKSKRPAPARSSVSPASRTSTSARPPATPSTWNPWSSSRSTNPPSP